MKYTALHFCGELFLLIDSGANLESIAKWANNTYLNNIGQYSIKELEDFLSDLSIIDTPGFGLEIPTIINRSLNILRYELKQKEREREEFYKRNGYYEDK